MNDENKPFYYGYYDEHELRAMGFASVGAHVRIAKSCVVTGFSRISVGDHVRIDDFCTIVVPTGGHFSLGSYIHVGGYVLISAGAGVSVADFSGISQGVRIYSRTDDYSGQYLSGPTVPPQFTRTTEGEVVLQRHVMLGSGCVVLPGAVLGEGCSVGAMSLVTKSLEPWGMYVGTPARRLKDRSQRLLELEKELRAEERDQP